MFSKVMKLVVLAVFLLTGAGCGGDDHTVVTENAEPNAIVSGRVIDSATKKPIAGAAVTLVSNGTKVSVTSNSSADPDLAGTFVFNGVVPTAYNLGYALTISAPGYALSQSTVPVPVSTDNTPVAVVLGNIELGKGCDVTVIVTDNGTPVPGVLVSASSYYDYVGAAISAVTDANGMALLKDLNQELSYAFRTAPKYAANGTILYPAANLSNSYQPQNSARTVAISIAPAMRDDAIGIIDSNLLSDGSNTYYGTNQRVIKTDSIIKIVFNYPVELTGPVSASYPNNLIPSADPEYGKVIPVTTLSGSLDQTGTILTVVNSAPYMRNQSYTFTMPIAATVNGRKQSYNFSSSSPFFSNPVYVTDDSVSGLSPLTSVKADNFNGTSGATATSSHAPVSVEFPEKVSGSYRVISTQDGAELNSYAYDAYPFGFSAGEMVYASNSGGADGAVVFKLPLYYSFYLPDNRPESPSEITIAFDVMDAEGNRFNKTVTLPVQ